MRTIITSFLFLLVCSSFGQSDDEKNFQDLEYRMIGPFRAGRTVGAIGIPSQPNVFYIGVIGKASADAVFD